MMTSLDNDARAVPFNVDEFRALTCRVIAAEKPGYWSDWTAEQQAMYKAGDWLGFSISRGYNDAEIADYAAWRRMILENQRAGVDPYTYTRDLMLKAALKNIALDAKGEVLLSSHAPFAPREKIMTFKELRERLCAMLAAEADPGSETAQLLRRALEAMNFNTHTCA